MIIYTRLRSGMERISLTGTNPYAPTEAPLPLCWCEVPVNWVYGGPFKVGSVRLNLVIDSWRHWLTEHWSRSCQAKISAHRMCPAPAEIASLLFVVHLEAPSRTAGFIEWTQRTEMNAVLCSEVLDNICSRAAKPNHASQLHLLWPQHY